MKRYIEIFLGGKHYRFLIDDELDKELRKSLSTSYQFDSNNTLIIDENDLGNSYQVKQLILKSILNQISTYDLDVNLQRQVDILKGYTDKKNTVYNSDLTKLESVLAEASEIYGGVRTNLAKKEVAEEQRETVQKNIEEIKTITETQEYEDVNTSDTTGSTDDKISEFKAILDDISYDETLREEVPINDIKDAMDRIVICSSMEEFIEKTDSNVGTYDVINAIKNKNEKIVLPPNTKLEDVIVEVIKTSVRDQNVLNKVVTYVERKSSYQNKTNGALESLRSSLKIHGLSARNLNYFGDQFFNEFERICNDTGISFEAMFADYFNGYSQNRKYNSPMDKFIRMYTKYNGGDENTRALLEAMLVKKAISRHLISSKYNNYLKDEYRNLNVNGNGYINFNQSSFTSVSGGADFDNISHIGQNNNTYETELNMAKAARSDGEIDNPDSYNLNGKSDDSKSDAEMLQASLAMNRRNKAIGGSVIASASGELNTTEETNSRKIALGASSRPFTSNNSLNSVYSDEEIADEVNDEDEDNLASEVEDGGGAPDSIEGNFDSNSDDGSDDAGDDSDGGAGGAAGESNDAIGDEAKKKGKDALKKTIIEFIKKNPWVLVVLGIIIFVFILILVLMASEEEKKNQLGYYDSACNFNDAKVTIISCESNNTLQNLNLKDYVIQMTYLYMKDENYSDETLKALMIILKTNALSFGGYTSGNKNISVKICDVYDGVVDENTLFDNEEDELEKLNNLYDQISEYLFISSTYKSSISSLGIINAITLNNTVLASLENAAATGLTYNEILDTVFEVTNEENIVVNDAKENLFLGDSRTQGMLLTSVINENNTVYGVGYGYNWLVGNSSFTGTTNAPNGGINALNAKMISGKSYNIIIWLGVNDLENANNYLEKYVELAGGEWSSHNLYIVSVGPVLDSKSQYAKNENINVFNNTIKDGIERANLSNLKYVDLGYSESSIKSYDNAGVHYSSEDYRNIYAKMTNNIVSGPSSISTKLALYKLSDYCRKVSNLGLGGYDYLPLKNTCEQIYVYDTPSGEDGTYPLEEYVAGVVAHEIGAFQNDEMYEVGAIAARTYALRRLQNSSDCSIAGNTTAQVFGKTDNEAIISAAERTRGLVLARNNSMISTEYDAFCWDTKDSSGYNLCQKEYDTGNTLKIPIEWANKYVGSISGRVFLENSRYQSHGRGMSQQGAYYLALEKGYKSKEILAFFYGSDAKLMSIYPASFTGNYPLDPDHELYKNLKFVKDITFETILANNGLTIDSYNENLKNIVLSSGVGTRAAVVNVAVSLIGSIAEQGYKLNYQWGGKRYAQGASALWGTPTDMTSICTSYASRYGNNYKCLNTYKWSSFDCSGFVNWALVNGFQLKDFNELKSLGLYTADAKYKRVNLDANKAVCQAGDVMVTPGHIVLVVGIDDINKRYIVAESTGSDLQKMTGGVKLSYKNYNASGYYCGSYEDFYK